MNNESDRGIADLRVILGVLSTNKYLTRRMEARIEFSKRGVECDRILDMAEQIAHSKSGIKDLTLLRWNSPDSCELSVIGSYKQV